MNINLFTQSTKAVWLTKNQIAAVIMVLVILATACDPNLTGGQGRRGPEAPKQAAPVEIQDSKQAPKIQQSKTKTTAATDTKVSEKPGNGQSKLTVGTAGRDSRAIYAKHTQDTLTNRFGETNFVKETLTNIVLGLSDIYGPDMIDKTIATVNDEMGDDTDPLKFANKLGLSLSNKGANADNRNNAKMAYLKFISSLISDPRIATDESISKSTISAVRSQVEKSASELIAERNEQVSTAREQGKLVFELAGLGDLIFLNGLVSGGEHNIPSLTNRALTVVSQVKVDMGFLPPSNDELAKIAGASLRLAGVLDARLDKQSSTLNAFAKSSLILQTVRAYETAESALLRLSANIYEDNVESKMKSEALVTTSLDLRRRSVKILIANKQFGKALSMAEQTTGIESQYKMIADTIAQIEAAYPDLSDKEKKQFGDINKLRNRRFEMMKRLINDNLDPTTLTGQTVTLARELVEHDQTKEAVRIIDWTLENIGDKNTVYVENASLHGQRLFAFFAQENRLSIEEANALIAEVPKSVRTAALTVAIDALGSTGRVDHLDTIADYLNKNSVGKLPLLFHNRATVNALLMQPQNSIIEARLKLQLQYGDTVLGSTNFNDMGPDTRKSIQVHLSGLRKYLASVDSIRTSLSSDKPNPKGYVKETRNALKIARWDLASDALVKHLDVNNTRRPIAALTEVVQFMDVMKARLGAPGVSEANRKSGEAVITRLSEATLELIDRRMKLASTDAKTSEAQVFINRGSADTDRGKKALASFQDARARRLAEVAVLSGLDARIKLTFKGQTLERAITAYDKKIAEQASAIKKEFSGIEESSSDNTYQYRKLHTALGELSVLRAQRDGVEDLMIARSDGKQFDRQPTLLRTKLSTLDHALNGKRGARNSLWAASNTRRYFEAFGGGKDKDRILDATIASHEVVYLQDRRFNMIMNAQSLYSESPGDMIAKELETEAKRWKGLASKVNPLSEVFGIGEFHIQRAERHFKLAERIREQWRVNSYRKQLEDNRVKNPQKAFEAIVVLQLANLSSQESIYAKHLDEFQSTKWYDARPIKSYYIAATMSSNLEELASVADETQPVHKALIKASNPTSTVANLPEEYRRLLKEKGFISNGKFVVPDNVKIELTKVGSEAVTEDSWIWGLDSVLTPKEFTILLATVALPGGSAARFARAGGGFFGSAAAYKTAGTAFRTVFKEGYSLAALRIGTRSGVLQIGARSSLAFTGRWFGERTAEAAMFTILSRMARTAVMPKSMLVPGMWNPSTIGTEFLQNTVIITALGAAGSGMNTTSKAIAKRLETQLAESLMKRAMFNVLSTGTIITGEAALLTELHSQFHGNTFSRKTFGENVGIVAMLRGLRFIEKRGVSEAELERHMELRYRRWAQRSSTKNFNAIETLMVDYGGEWDAVRSAFTKGKISKQHMKHLVDYRKQVVDQIAKDIAEMLDVKPQDFGSQNLTSDYDISFKGEKAELAQQIFTLRLKNGWSWSELIGGNLPGIRLDTNAYTDPIFRDFEAGPNDVRYQDQYANLMARKNLDNTAAWSQYKSWVLENAPKDRVGKVREMFKNVDKLYEKFEAEVDAKKIKLASENSTNLNANELSFEARQELYGEKLSEIIRLKLQFNSAPEIQRSELAQKLRNMQSEALYFAPEAYATEGAINHVVFSIQMAGRDITLDTLMADSTPDLKGVIVTVPMARQSFLEQRSYMLREIKNGSSTEKSASKGAKYSKRWLDAAKIAGLDLKPFRELIKTVLEVESNRSDLKTVKEILDTKYGEEKTGNFLKDMTELANTLNIRLISGGNLPATKQASKGSTTTDIPVEKPVELPSKKVDPERTQDLESKEIDSEKTTDLPFEEHPYAVSEALQNMGLSRELADYEAGLWQNVLGMDGQTSIVMGARRSGVPASRVMESAGYSEAQIRQAFNNFYSKVPGYDVKAREQVVEGFLSGESRTAAELTIDRVDPRVQEVMQQLEALGVPEIPAYAAGTVQIHQNGMSTTEAVVIGGYLSGVNPRAVMESTGVSPKQASRYILDYLTNLRGMTEIRSQAKLKDYMGNEAIEVASIPETRTSTLIPGKIVLVDRNEFIDPN